MLQRRIGAWLACLGAASILYYLYFFQLTGTGMLGPDEPRYAAIGREMAHSGDWITPRLWGSPWFEKPALLYWMTAAAYRSGLSGELAPRLPVALASVALLGFYWWALRREFGGRAAWFAAAMLATSAGWLAYSHVAVTDLPMAAAFSAAMLLALGWIEKGERARLPAVGFLLGVAALAKGLVPLALAIPLVWMGRRRLPDLLHPRTSAPFLLAAMPWYMLCYLRNGTPFLREFFWEHHFERAASDALQHVQPFWFYAPVLAGALFPWTPALAALFHRGLYADRRRRFLLLWLVFGLVFFSLSVNKLPGYLLPLLPPATALMGIALAEGRLRRWALPLAAALLTLAPPLISVLPMALASGLSRAPWPDFRWYWSAPAILALLVWLLEGRGKRGEAMALIVAGVIAGVLAIEVKTLPEIDRLATIRPLWRKVAPLRDSVCVEDLHRSLRYGLNYYSEVPLPDCSESPREFAVTGKAPPRLTPRGGAL